MPEVEIIKLNVAPSMAVGLEVRIVSASGRRGHENLTLFARTGFPMSDVIDQWELEIPAADARALWAILRDFAVEGEQPESMMGLDGTSYGLTINTHDLKQSISWWQYPPEEWRGPKRLVSKLIRLAGPRAAGFRAW
jgi:hypothetical protein